MFKSSREIDIMQFHILNALFIDGYVIKSGMNIIKRLEKGGKEYEIYHSDDFSKPYTSFPLDHVPALLKFVFKRLIDGGMVVIDEDQFEAVEIKSGTMKLVEKTPIENKKVEQQSQPTVKLKVA